MLVNYAPTGEVKPLENVADEDIVGAVIRNVRAAEKREHGHDASVEVAGTSLPYRHSSQRKHGSSRTSTMS